MSELRIIRQSEKTVKLGEAAGSLRCDECGCRVTVRKAVTGAYVCERCRRGQ
jgi:hypothetical protein